MFMELCREMTQMNKERQFHNERHSYEMLYSK